MRPRQALSRLRTHQIADLAAAASTPPSVRSGISRRTFAAGRACLRKHARRLSCSACLVVWLATRLRPAIPPKVLLNPCSALSRRVGGSCVRTVARCCCCRTPIKPVARRGLDVSFPWRVWRKERVLGGARDYCPGVAGVFLGAAALEKLASPRHLPKVRQRGEAGKLPLPFL